MQPSLFPPERSDILVSFRVDAHRDHIYVLKARSSIRFTCLFFSLYFFTSTLGEHSRQECIICSIISSGGSHWYLSPTVVRSTTSVKMNAVSKRNIYQTLWLSTISSSSKWACCYTGTPFFEPRYSKIISAPNLGERVPELQQQRTTQNIYGFTRNTRPRGV